MRRTTSHQSPSQTRTRNSTDSPTSFLVSLQRVYFAPLYGPGKIFLDDFCTTNSGGAPHMNTTPSSAMIDYLHTSHNVCLHYKLTWKYSSNVDILLQYTDDDNRVKLKPLNGREDCQHDYINASYIDVSV